MKKLNYVSAVAIIDSCNFTRIAIESICLSLSKNIKIYHFTSLKKMLNHPAADNIDVVFYDILCSHEVFIDPEKDIRLLRQKSPKCKVCVISSILQFLQIPSADQELDKRLRLEDLYHCIKIICQHDNLRYRRDYRVIFPDRLPLSKCQIALLRGYLSNMSTKHICQVLHCDIRKFYGYREKILVKAKQNPDFFRTIGSLSAR